MLHLRKTPGAQHQIKPAYASHVSM